MSSEKGFKHIANYKNLVRELEMQESCSDLMSMDQEVPQVRSYLEEGDFKAEVKMEAQDEPQTPEIISYIENFLSPKSNTMGQHNDFLTTNSNTSLSLTPQYSSLPLSTTDLADVPGNTVYSQNSSSNSPYNSNNSTPSSSLTNLPAALRCATTSSASPLLSSVAYPVASLQSPLSNSYTNISNKDMSSRSLSDSNIKNINININGNSPTQTRTFVSIGASGCTLVTSTQSSPPPSSIISFPTDFLSEGDKYSSSTANQNFLSAPSLCVPEDKLDFLDLDNQQLSLYDDVKPTAESLKLGNLGMPTDADENLEDAALLMRETIQNECDSLNLPYDPLLWTPDHVRKWVSWVCQKKNYSQIQIHHSIDGRTLCALQLADFLNRFGHLGEVMWRELDLLKAVSSTGNNIFYQEQSAMNTVRQMPYMQPQKQQQQQASIFSYMEQDISVMGSHGSQMSVGGPCVSPSPSSSSQDSNTAGSTGFHTDHSDEENIVFSSTSDLHAKVNKPSHVTNHVHPGPIKTGRGHKQTIHLWQFLRELLLSKENHNDCIRWIDRNTGIFKIEDSKKVAHLWGMRKNRPAMNYDKLSRSVRQYYKKGIIKKTEQSKRLVYQFCAGYM